MKAIHGGSPEPSALPTRDGLWRLRPGEAPGWVDLTLERAVVCHWRDRASAVGLGVDAWLALLGEMELVRARLSQVGLAIATLVEEATRSLTVTRLAPTPSLRQWAAQLQDRRRATEPVPDELPTVVLPERLIAQIAPVPIGQFLSEAIERAADTDALVVEQAATSVGQTSEAWAYMTTVRLLGAGTT